jgi:hypothetical protein
MKLAILISSLAGVAVSGEFYSDAAMLCTSVTLERRLRRTVVDLLIVSFQIESDLAT